MKIDGSIPASMVKTQVTLGELGLKDGQNIVGRIINTSMDQVLLQLAGKTISAQLEGKPLIPGTTVLFGVTSANSGKVELRVLTNLTKSVTGEATVPSAWPGEAELKTVIATTCRQLGLQGTAAEIGEIYRNMQAVAVKYGQTPPPEVFVLLRERNWPITPGAMLMAWLYCDQKLRNLIWNKLRWIAHLRSQTDLLPPVWNFKPIAAPLSDLGQLKESPVTGFGMQTSDGPSFNLTMADEVQTLADPLLHSGDATQDKSIWEQLQPLLEKSLNLERFTVNPAQSTLTVVPMLVHIASALIMELRLNWSSRTRPGADSGSEELIRMVIPTENMGDIYLSVLLSIGKTQINFKVASPEVREFLNRNLGELKNLMGENTYIAVGIAPVNAGETRVDLWM